MSTLFKKRTRNLNRFYIAAFISIALLTTCHQVLVDYSLSSAKKDASIINMAGRQRMFSQKITKEMTLMIYSGHSWSDDEIKKKQSEFNVLLNTFKASHDTLKHSDSMYAQQQSAFFFKPIQNTEEINQKFETIQPFFDTLTNNAKIVSSSLNARLHTGGVHTEAFLEEVLSAESAFLKQMDNIVFLYEQKAQKKLQNIRVMGFALVIFTLVVLILEALFIFKPTLTQIEVLLQKLLASKRALRKSNRELESTVAERTQALQKSNDLLSNILHDAADGIITYSDSGQIFSMNQAAYRIFQYDKEDSEPLASIPPTSTSMTSNSTISIKVLFNEYFPKQGDQYLFGVCKNGKKVPMRVSVSKIEADQQPLYTIIFQDATQEEILKKQQEAALQAAIDSSKTKAEFLACMSHEIRTPMNGVMGLIDLLSMNNSFERQSHYLKLAKSSALALMSTINDVLDFSKIEAGKITLEHELLDLADFLNELAQVTAVPAQKKGVELITEFSGIEPGVSVSTDPNRLRQILNNLLSNAVKFTEVGHIMFGASLEQGSEGHYQLHCVIKDEGHGIKEEEINRLFKPFIQTEGTITRKFGGTGLGLAIAKELCHLLKGTINVESQVGEGSEFSIQLPIDVVRSQQAAQHPIKLPAEHCVYLCLNSGKLYDAFSKQLDHWQIEHERLLQADDALETLQRLSGDVAFRKKHIIVDAHFDGVLGTDFIARLVKNGVSDAYRIILLSDMIDDHVLPKSVKKSLWDRLYKPLEWKTLASSLAQEEAFSHKPAERSLPAHEAFAFDQNINILLVEDFEINRLVARAMLEELGASVKTVNSGVEALKHLKAMNDQPFDLIFMDFYMPDLDGTDVTELIRSGEVGNIHRDTPIVALTAGALAEDKAQCLQSGMNDYLIKPVKKVQLKNVIFKQVLGMDPADEEAKPMAGLPGLLEEPTTPLQKTHQWDHQHLFELFGNRKRSIEQVIESFLVGTPEQMTILSEAIEEKNWPEVQAIAHRLVSSSDSLGAPDACATALAIELTARYGDKAKLEKLEQTLHQQLDHLTQNVCDFVRVQSTYYFD